MDLSSAIQLYPNDTRIFLARGNIYHDLGEQEKAIADFDRIIELDPTSIEAYNRAMAYTSLGNWEQASLNFNRAIEIDPENALIYMHRGNFYHAQNENVLAYCRFQSRH